MTARRDHDALLVHFHAGLINEQLHYARDHARKGETKQAKEHMQQAVAIGMCALPLISLKTNRKAPVRRSTAKDGSGQGLTDRTPYKGKGKK